MKEEMNASAPAYIKIVDFIAAGTTPRAVIEFRLLPEAQWKLQELIALDREGSLWNW